MLENKIYKIVLIIAFILSTVSIVGNIFAGFPFSVQIKWIFLAVITVVSYMLYNKGIEKSKFFYFLFIILIFTPFGWIDSGGSSNNTIAYIFVILIVTTYLFEGKQRSTLIVSLIVVFEGLLMLEYYYPETLKIYNNNSQFIDRLIQMPLVLTAIYFLIKKFAVAYNDEKIALDKITNKLKILNEKLAIDANYDKLTTAANRRLFDKYLAELFSNRLPIEAYVILIDFDNFKYINDNFGHIKGDEMLFEFVDIAKTIFKEPNIISRWGGDEFAIIFYGSQNDLLEKLKFLSEKLSLINNEIDIDKTISIGVANYVKESSATELLSRADKALYESKSNGKNRVSLNLIG